MLRTALFLLCLSMFSSASASNCGVFRVVKGKVTFQKKNKGKFRKARVNKKVCSGDRVKAENGARTKIVMAGGNEINVSPSSELIIEKYTNNDVTGEKKVLLNVIYGKIRSNVKQKYKGNEQSFYRVKTKSAVAGVRGTEFLVNFDASKNTSKVVTFEGQVAVGRLDGTKMGSVVMVGPGQFTANSKGTDPLPAADVPAKDFASMDKDTNITEPGGARTEDRGVSSDPASSGPSDDKKSEPSSKEKTPQTTPNGDNREPASTGGAANDFDNHVDTELANNDLAPGNAVDLNPGTIAAPPTVNLRDITTLPGFQENDNVRDQITNRSTTLKVITCVRGSANCGG